MILFYLYNNASITYKKLSQTNYTIQIQKRIFRLKITIINLEISKISRI